MMQTLNSVDPMKITVMMPLRDNMKQRAKRRREGEVHMWVSEAKKRNVIPGAHAGNGACSVEMMVEQDMRGVDVLMV